MHIPSSWTMSAAGALAALALAACATTPTAVQGPTHQRAAHPPAAMAVWSVPSGVMFSSAGMAFEGGRMDEPRAFMIGAVLVDHPKGRLLFDAGFGRDVAEHIKTTPKIMRDNAKYRLDKTVADQLADAGIPTSSLKAVVLTHAHWDHVSGLEHLKGVPVWVSKPELDFVKSDAKAAELARSLGLGDYHAYSFPDGAYEGFSRSWDVFHDGSVVLVPAPGHTPGSIIAFLTLPGGRRYALIGDAAWQTEGVALPAQKPALMRWVDNDADETRGMLQKLHALAAAEPGLVIVPAHDARAWQALPLLKDRKGSR